MRRALRFVDGNFNTPCPALGFGANDAVGAACDELAALVSTRCMLDVGVPISDDENDVESGVGIRALGE